MQISDWFGWHLPFVIAGLGAWRLAGGAVAGRLGAALLVAAGLLPEAFLALPLLLGGMLVARMATPPARRAWRAGRSLPGMLMALDLVVALSLLRVAGIPDRPPRLAWPMFIANAIAQCGFVVAARMLRADSESDAAR